MAKMANRSGTERPDRIGRTLLGAHVDSVLAKDFQLMARAKGTTGSALIQKFVEDWVEDELDTDAGLKSVVEMRRRSAAAQDAQSSRVRRQHRDHVP